VVSAGTHRYPSSVLRDGADRGLSRSQGHPHDAQSRVLGEFDERDDLGEPERSDEAVGAVVL
jgi:hypothetical protein